MILLQHKPFFHLLSFLLIVSLPFSQSFYLTDSNPLLSFNSQVREVHLYTDNHRKGMYLQMTQDGRVSGNDVQTPYSVLELKSVKTGHVVIQGRSSALFLCVDSRGSLRGQSHYTDADCTFQELLLADGYTRFLSSHYGFPVSLAPKHSPGRHSIPFTRFLPLRNILTKESVSESPMSSQTHFNVDSDDLFGMGLNSVASPQFSVDI